jgi:hypothetical protein
MIQLLIEFQGRVEPAALFHFLGTMIPAIPRMSKYLRRLYWLCIAAARSRVHIAFIFFAPSEANQRRIVRKKHYYRHSFSILITLR